MCNVEKFDNKPATFPFFFSNWHEYTAFHGRCSYRRSSKKSIHILKHFFAVYVNEDASGDVGDDAHERAMQRMIQARAKPITSLQYLLELQRDWARSETYDENRGDIDCAWRLIGKLMAGSLVK